MTPENTIYPDAVIRRALQNWYDERNSATLYHAFAKLERAPKQAQVFEHLAALEEAHAVYWEGVLKAFSEPIPIFKARRRTRLLICLAKRFGLGLVLPRVAKLERLEADGYLAYSEAGPMLEAEQENARLLEHLGHHEFSEFVKKLVLRIRKPLLLLVGGLLFATSIATAHNVQIEGFFFGLFTGAFFGGVLHYLIGKVLVALPFGRVWCGWACWTAALLDQLPYKKSSGWLAKKWRRLRYVHFGLSCVLVALLVFVFNYQQGGLGSAAIMWFLLGNVIYWLLGVSLAVGLKDNRAFCKYACPIPVILKQTSRPALLKVTGDATACLNCQSEACTTLCPMDIDIPAYIKEGKRVLSSECILCQQCVAICPPNTLELSFDFDLGGEEKLELRTVKTSQSQG